MLTVSKVSAAKPNERPYKLSDDRGLYLLVTPSGAKYWRYKYRYGGKEKLLALGTVDDVTLAEARDARDEARKVLKLKRDPGLERKQEKAGIATTTAHTFEAVAREWYRKQQNLWAARHAEYIIRRLEADLFPYVGTDPINSLKSKQITACLERIEARGTLEMARRCRQYVSAIYAYAIAKEYATGDPAAHLTKVMEKAPRTRHHAALAAKELPDFYRKLRAYEGHPLTPLAVRLLMLTAVRTSELIGARWDEVDGAVWTIPASRMKMKRDHIVPLSKAALTVLKELRKVSGATDYLFPSTRNFRRTISNNTILFALYRMGYHSRATGHGMRALFSTEANESGRFKPDVIEKQLAHDEKDDSRRPYNRAEYLPERVKMMQWWGEFLTKAESKKSKL